MFVFVGIWFKTPKALYCQVFDVRINIYLSNVHASATKTLRTLR